MDPHPGNMLLITAGLAVELANENRRLTCVPDRDTLCEYMVEAHRGAKTRS